MVLDVENPGGLPGPLEGGPEPHELEGVLVESWPICESLIERARALAAYGRGERDPDLMERISAMWEECRALELWEPTFEIVVDREDLPQERA